MKTVIIILLTASGLVYHPVGIEGDKSCLDVGESWRDTYTTHAWDKVEGDGHKNGYYVDDGRFKDSLLVGYIC
jgi:hypothetical protein